MEKPKQQNRVGEFCFVDIRYLHPETKMTESYWNRNKRYVLKDIRVFWKEEKMVNKVDQWCIVLCHGNLEGMELYYV